MSTIKGEEANVASGVEMIHTPIKFRTLKPTEIECRPQTVGKGEKPTVKLLLYKDARSDMTILDETIGAERWQREHKELKGHLYCGVGILCSGEWVWKWDCGVESNTEQAKGESSDSFKRACVNWGIGRELYTSPKVVIELVDSDYFKGNFCQSFSVKDIEISSERVITYLSIVDRLGKERFTYGKKKGKMTTSQRTSALKRLARGEDIWAQLKDAFTFDESSLRKELKEFQQKNAL